MCLKKKEKLESISVLSQEVTATVVQQFRHGSRSSRVHLYEVLPCKNGPQRKKESKMFTLSEDFLSKSKKEMAMGLEK